MLTILASLALIVVKGEHQCYVSDGFKTVGTQKQDTCPKGMCLGAWLKGKLLDFLSKYASADINNTACPRAVVPRGGHRSWFLGSDVVYDRNQVSVSGTQTKFQFRYQYRS